MAPSASARNLPVRLASGAYFLHSGLDKWGVDEQHAKGLHAFASGAYPFLRTVAPQRFVRVLAVGEIVVGTALLAPMVPAAVAGAALTAFSSGLVGLYLRTPSLRRPGSVRPSEAGVGISKDVWLLGMGLSLLADRARTRRRRLFS